MAAFFNTICRLVKLVLLLQQQSLSVPLPKILP